jgi:hypothetical protein
MNICIPVSKPTARLSLFVNQPTCDNLISDIKYLCSMFFCNVNKISDEKEIVLKLHYSILRGLDEFRDICSTCYDMQKNFFEVDKIIRGYIHFIRIENRTFTDFNIEVSIILNNQLVRFTLRD